jgi:hypothetical protein
MSGPVLSALELCNACELRRADPASPAGNCTVCDASARAASNCSACGERPATVCTGPTWYLCQPCAAASQAYDGAHGLPQAIYLPLEPIGEPCLPCYRGGPCPEHATSIYS